MGSSPICREVTGALYPDTVYGHDSGGRPGKIPELTYGRFRDFHRRFYHPSNARIFLDGSVNIADVLGKLDAFLSPFERQESRAEIGLQAPLETRLRIPYASAAVEDKAILAFGWSAGTMEDASHAHAVDILADYLCGSNEAPLKKALLGQGVCKDASMGCYDYRQIPLFLVLKDTSEENFGAIRRIVCETLEQICRSGVDRPRILSLIDRDEFAAREMNSSRPAGLAYFSRVLRQWLYGGEPAAALDTTGIYGRLRSGAERGLFEGIIRERILENGHRAEIGFIPDPALAGRMAAEDRAEMESRRRKLSPDELRAIAGEVSALKAWQGRDDLPEDIAKIPGIDPGDLSPAGSPAEGTVETAAGVTRIVSRPTAAGIFYLELYFPVDDLPAGDLVELPLFARLPGRLGTSRRSALELQTLIAANTGRLVCSTVSTKRGRYFKVSVAALAGKAAAALELVKEVLFETRFDDAGEIEKILRQKQISAEREVSNDGRALALRAARRGFAERWAAADILYGERQLRWLQAQKTDDGLIGRFGDMPGRLLKREGLIVSRTENLPEGLLDPLLAALDPGKRGAPVRIPAAADCPRAFLIDGDTGFSARVVPLPGGMPVTGAMHVASRILSLGYLHREIREIGGAYGVHMRVTPNGLVECTSYRDPRPFGSLEKMAGIGPALRTFVGSGADIDRFVVATAASLEPYRPPADAAFLFADLYMDERTPEDEERIRREVLATTKADLLRFAELLETLPSSATACVVGGERQLSGCDAAQIRPVVRK